MSNCYPCGKPKTPKDTVEGIKPGVMGPAVDVKSVEDIRTPEDLLRNCYPAFGGGYVSRIFSILDRVVGAGIPLIVACSGPITASHQDQVWVNALSNTGWVAYYSVTGAIRYHDGHKSLKKFEEGPFYRVPVSGADAELKDAGVFRITDLGAKEEILFDQDRMITTVLQQPELQHKMTGTEFSYLLGKYYAAQEEAFGVKPGFLATCYRNSIPVFVGAPGDGSDMLNSVKLWALDKLGILKHKFEIDIHAEVFESCAYHYWGLKASAPKQIAILILGGGFTKNFALQPEPTLGQIFLMDDISGYEYDVQIVGAPPAYGDVTGCEPAEAVTWGKVDKEAIVEHRVESLHADYTTVIPMIVWALIDKRRRYMEMYEKMGPELFERHPDARGYLRLEGQYRLFDHREELVSNLLKAIGEPANVKRLEQTLDFPLQQLLRAKK